MHGKGNKIRPVPLYADVANALHAWRQAREQLPELATEPLLFSRLGTSRVDGSFPDSGGPLSTNGIIRIVRPILLAAGVPAAQAHPHTLRHTFGRLYMASPRAELSRLQRIMGHASPDTTSRYVHHDITELDVEHRRIDRLRTDPLARHQENRRRQANGRAR